MTESDVMREKIKEWKAAHKGKSRDFNFEMLCGVLRLVNSDSAVKVARNPLDADRDWIPDTTCRNIAKITVDDQGRLVLHARADKTVFSVERLAEEIRRLKKHAPLGSAAVMFQVSETKVVQLTDVYSHALVKDSWAGLPFDLVLAYYEE